MTRRFFDRRAVRQWGALACALALSAALGGLRAHERVRGVFAILERSGKVLFKLPEAHEVGDFSCGRALVRVHRGEKLLYGYVDREGRSVIDPRFDFAAPFSSDLAFVQLRAERKSGYIDTSGKLVIELECLEGRAFSEGLAPFKQGPGGKFGYIDASGSIKIAPQFEDAQPFAGGRSRVIVGGKAGFIDRSGALVIEARFERAWSFSEGLARVRGPGGKICFVDAGGATVVGPLVDVAEAGDLRDGRVLIRVKTRWGYLDAAGKTVVPVQLEAATPFSGGMAAASAGGKWFVIDREGRRLRDLPCEWTTGFAGGLAPAVRGERMFYVDDQGRTLDTPGLLRAYPFTGDLARVELP